MPAIRNRQQRPPGPYVVECTHLSGAKFPYRLQHLILSVVQKLLEEALFVFVKAWYPRLLEELHWESPEAGELNKWWSELSTIYPRSIPPQATQFHNGSITCGELLTRLSHLRHASVHRHICTIAVLRAMMVDGVALADGIKDFTRRNKIRCIELAIHFRDQEMVERILQAPLDLFENFRFPGSTRSPAVFGFNTVFLEKAVVPAVPAAPVPPALLGDKYRRKTSDFIPLVDDRFQYRRSASPPALLRDKHRRKTDGFLPLGDASYHYRRIPSPPVLRPSVGPSGNTRSQIRLRERARNEPYPTDKGQRDLAKRAATKHKSLSSIGVDMIGDMGKTKDNPFDLTADSDGEVGMSHLESLKDAGDVGKSKEPHYKFTAATDNKLKKAQSKGPKVAGDNISPEHKSLRSPGNLIAPVLGDASGSKDDPFDLTADLNEGLGKAHSKSLKVDGNNVSPGYNTLQSEKICLATSEDSKKPVSLLNENPRPQQTSFTNSSVSSSKQGFSLQNEVQHAGYIHSAIPEAPRQDAPSNPMTPQKGQTLPRSTLSATEPPLNFAHRTAQIEFREALTTPQLPQEQISYRRALLLTHSPSVPNAGQYRRPSPTPSPVLQRRTFASLQQTALHSRPLFSFSSPSQNPGLKSNPLWSTYRERDISPDGIDD